MQSNLVLNSEADAWFERNKSALIEAKNFSNYKKIASFVKKNEKVLEIGSSFGYGLNYILNQVNCEVYGIEASGKAIEYGKTVYPKIYFEHGVGESSNFLENKKFDHVILGFCLYLVDDNALDVLLAKVYQSLQKGGFLHIYDFDSSVFKESEYGHDSRMKVYKRNYLKVITRFEDLFLVEKTSWSHSGKEFTSDKNERCASLTFFKELE